MSHRSWPSSQPGGPVKLGPCATCGGKITYPSRKAARSAARAYHPGDSGLAAYRCPLDAGYWHVGHSNPALRDAYRRTA